MKVKITLDIEDLKLLIAYFEGDVEAMGDNARETQPQGRRIQTTLRAAVATAERTSK